MDALSPCGECEFFKACPCGACGSGFCGSPLPKWAAYEEGFGHEHDDRQVMASDKAPCPDFREKGSNP